jgi:flagellin-like protein
MNKLLKNVKALSPVIATIILVAVTVAVSIAVAAWMGALTFSFTKNDQFQVNAVAFVGTSGTANQINMSIQNTGSSSWSIQPTCQVNAVSGFKVQSYGNGGGSTLLNCTNGKSINIYIAMTTGWLSGNQYSITLLLTDGNKITYVANAP